MLDFKAQGDNIKGMETLTVFQPLFTAGIFFIGVLAFFVGFLALLLTGFNMMLNAKIEPIKEKQALFDKRLSAIESKLDQLLAQKKS